MPNEIAEAGGIGKSRAREYVVAQDGVVSDGARVVEVMTRVRFHSPPPTQKLPAPAKAKCSQRPNFPCERLLKLRLIGQGMNGRRMQPLHKKGRMQARPRKCSEGRLRLPHLFGVDG